MFGLGGDVAAEDDEAMELSGLPREMVNPCEPLGHELAL